MIVLIVEDEIALMICYNTYSTGSPSFIRLLFPISALDCFGVLKSVRIVG